jgi:hypothetical protein
MDPIMIMNLPRRVSLPLLLAIATSGLGVSGCVSNDSKPADPPSQTEAAPPPPTQARSAAGGYDLSKNKRVTDSSKAESGQGTLVKGINGWEGEISGIPTANSPFAQLRIGMSEREVHDLAGWPTDQGTYRTGKSFIPFYHGSDRSRMEAAYRGLGRLIYSSNSTFSADSRWHLTWIIHNSNDSGYR